MGFWENNKDSITSGLKSAGKYGYQGTKYVAKTGYKASKKHYNNSKARRERKSGKKNSSDEEYDSEDEMEYERKPTDIRSLKDPKSFPPPPLKPGQKTYTGQQQQQMPNGQASYAFQGAYQGQPGAGSMEQSQYAQPQYNQYPQQQLQQGVMPQQQQLQQGVVPQQPPIYGEQVPPYGSNSNATSYQSLPQQNQPQNAIPSQVSLNSASQQSTGFVSQNLQYGTQSSNPALSPSFQNGLQCHQQPQYVSHGSTNLGQSQFPSGQQQQPTTQFGQQVLPSPAQPQQQQQGQPLPPPRGQVILPAPGEPLSNGFGQQQQQQQQQPLNQNNALLPQMNVEGVSGMAAVQPVYGQAMSSTTNMQDSNPSYGASPMQGQPPVGGQPPVPVRMQPQPPQPMQQGNIYPIEPSLDSTGSTPHFEVTPFDPDAPAPKPKIDIPTVDVSSLPRPPTHRDRGAVVHQEPAPSGKIQPNTTSSAASLPAKHSRTTTADNERNSGNKENDESTSKSSILGHYDVDVNIMPPPKPFRHGLDSVPSEHTRKNAPERAVPILPPRNNVEPPPPPSRGNFERTESVLSTNAANVQEDPISNFLPPPKPFRHTETKQNQNSKASPVEMKGEVLPGHPSEEDRNVEPSLVPQSKPQSQSQFRRAHMETQPIQNFQPPPKPFRRSQSSNSSDSSYTIDGPEANHGRGRGRIAKHHDGDEYNPKSENSTENGRLGDAPNSFIRKRAPTPPAPSRSEKLHEGTITSEVDSSKDANKYEKSIPPVTSSIQAQQSTKKAPPPVVKPKPRNFSLKANEYPKELTREATGQDEVLNSITNELSHIKLRKTNVNLEKLGGSKKVKDSSPVPSDLDEKYVSASGSITPPRPPPSRSSPKKVPPVVPKKNDNLKKKPPVVPKKKPLLKSLEPRPIEMERAYSGDISAADDNLNPFERYKRNVVPQEDDRLHKLK
ncbi:Aim3p [Saccharomyces cerevisiae YJM1307]|nr:Aim3p [Saccharomyces cerevisiae YJM1307]